jgi:glutaconate CoA-transferase subunit A
VSHQVRADLALIAVIAIGNPVFVGSQTDGILPTSGNSIWRVRVHRAIGTRESAEAGPSSFLPASPIRGCHHRAVPQVSKVTSMHDAIAELVRDGDTVAIEGFTHLISFGAGHEIIRQRKRDLTLARMTPDVIYDQMVAAGVCRKLVFSWLGNPGVGGLHAIRRVTEGVEASLELEEYSHFGMVGRYTAGAMNLPFFPLRSYFETDLPKANPLIRQVRSPYGEETVYAVPPLKPDVTIVHAQRADAAGDTQVWGLLGCQKEAAFAAERVIVVVEELVGEEVVRADPNRTVIPGLIVDAVVVEPLGAHPSYVQGYYDRDNRFYLDWDAISRDAATLDAWLDEWVHGVSGRDEYVAKLGEARIAALRPGPAPSGSVDYGDYR